MVTTSPGCFGPGGSMTFVTVSGQSAGYAVSSSGSTSAASTFTPETCPMAIGLLVPRKNDVPTLPM